MSQLFFGQAQSTKVCLLETNTRFFFGISRGAEVSIIINCATFSKNKEIVLLPNVIPLSLTSLHPGSLHETSQNASNWRSYWAPN
jgi:hypothetical protein